MKSKKISIILSPEQTETSTVVEERQTRAFDLIRNRTYQTQEVSSILVLWAKGCGRAPQGPIGIVIADGHIP